MILHSPTPFFLAAQGHTVLGVRGVKRLQADLGQRDGLHIAIVDGFAHGGVAPGDAGPNHLPSRAATSERYERNVKCSYYHVVAEREAGHPAGYPGSKLTRCVRAAVASGSLLGRRFRGKGGATTGTRSEVCSSVLRSKQISHNLILIDAHSSIFPTLDPGVPACPFPHTPV